MGDKKTVEVPEELIVESGEKTNTTPKKGIVIRIRSLLRTKKRKVLAAVITVLILLAVILLIPVTRYFVLSPIVKKDVALRVVDSETGKPVTNVSIEIGGISSQSNKDGRVVLDSVPVGEYKMKVTKQYYADYSLNYTVPVFSSPVESTFDIKATGRKVSISISNKISGEPLSDATIESSGSKSITDSDGVATIILPSKDEILKATITKDGFNSTEVELKIDESVVNTYALTPSGSVYFLSKATGNINVMKSNLDGADATIAVAATGQESDYETSLLSSRDWQYSALSATRTDNKQRLYLINAKNELSVIDEGDATFSMVGWYDHTFIYTVYRNTRNAWDDKKQAIKSYNADTKKISVLNETSGVTISSYEYAYESYGGIYIMKNEIVFLKNWYYNSPHTNRDVNRTHALYSVSPNDESKKVIKTFPVDKSVNIRLYEPQGLYIQVSSPSIFYEYEDGKIKEVTGVNDNKFNSTYPTFLISPSGKQVLWSEPRDGKNTIFIGNDAGQNPKTVGNLSEYTPYGWYGSNDEYILLTKNNSELYIGSATKVIGENGYQPLKVTDYHKTRTYPGYGYGYGGQ